MENIIFLVVTILAAASGAIITSRMDANDRRDVEVRARKALAMRNKARLAARRSEL